MNKSGTLIVIDMQNDFLTGALPSKEAQALVRPIAELISAWEGDVILTRDTHNAGYLETLEGRKLPVEHCLEGTAGWCVADPIMKACYGKGRGVPCIFDKRHFASDDWPGEFGVRTEKVYLVGTRTDICVVSNALAIRLAYPELDIHVVSDLCSGTTPKAHAAALTVLESCQIAVETSEEAFDRSFKGPVEAS